MADPREWIIEADDDLRSATTLLVQAQAKHACFHTQQAAEKGLKALLLHLTGRTPKSHDLVQLSHAARAADPAFPDLLVPLQILQNYYMFVRYPDARPPGAAMPSVSEAQAAIGSAERLLAEVRKRLP